MIPTTIPEYKLGANLPMLYNRPRFSIPEQPSISGLNLQTDRTIFVPTMMMTAVQQSHTNMVIPCKTIGPISGGGYKRPPPGNIMLGQYPATGNVRNEKLGLGSHAQHPIDSVLPPQANSFYAALNSDVGMVVQKGKIVKKSALK